MKFTRYLAERLLRALRLRCAAEGCTYPPSLTCPDGLCIGCCTVNHLYIPHGAF